MNIAFFLLGVGTGALAIGLNRYSHPGHNTASALLGVSGFTIFIAGLFNTYPSGQELPTAAPGFIHFIAVTCSMLTVLIAAFVLSGRLRHYLHWDGLARVMLWWAIVMLASMSIHVATGETAIAGLLQRIYVVVVVGWLLFVANLLRVGERRHLN